LIAVRDQLQLTNAPLASFLEPHFSLMTDISAEMKHWSLLPAPAAVIHQHGTAQMTNSPLVRRAVLAL
jgi:hypothetical protein